MPSRHVMEISRAGWQRVRNWMTARGSERARGRASEVDARLARERSFDDDEGAADDKSTCPITLLPIVEPHHLHGVAFEREALVQWITTRRMAVHPTSRRVLDERDVLHLERAAQRPHRSLVRVAWADTVDPHYGVDPEEGVRSFLAHTLFQLADEGEFSEAAHVLVQMHQLDAPFALATLARMDDGARRELGDERVT